MRVTPDSIERRGGDMTNIYLSDEIKGNFCELMQWYMDEHGAEFRLALLNSDGLMSRVEHECEIENAIEDYRKDADELSKKQRN